MCSLGNNGVDVYRTDTQPFDDHLSPPSSSSSFGEDEDRTTYSPLTNQFNDTIPVHCEFETQVVDFAGETQAFDIADETQAFDIAGETQPLDDTDCHGNVDFTQILNDFDGEVANDSCDDETEKTEIMIDTDLSDGESIGQSVDREKSRFAIACEYDRNGSEDLRSNVMSRDKSYNPGPTRFASVRVASLRSSGSASHKFSIHSGHPGPSTITNDNKDMEPVYLKNSHADQQTDLSQSCKNVGDLGNIRCKVGSSTVRRLFTEDSTPDGDTGNLHTSHDVGDIEPLLLTARDDQLAGLSYIDSQEPGDLTQADALDFVDKFLKDNSMEFDQEGIGGKNVVVQSKSVPISKEKRNLATFVNCVRTVGESRIFEWDDNQEDEGGGDLFCRRKEEFFGFRSSRQISYTEPRKLGRRRLDACGHKNVLNKEKENELAQEASVSYKLNLSNDLENNAVKSGEQNLSNVGYDTQMAAEAMEALFQNENIGKCANSDANQRLQNGSNEFLRGSPENSLSFRQSSTFKRRRASHAVSGKSNKRKPLNTNKDGQSASSHKFSENILEQYKNKCMLKNGNAYADDDSGNEDTTYVCSDSGNTVQKQLLHIVELSPVAHRTRHSMAVNQSKKAKISSGESELSNHCTEVAPFKKKRSATSNSKAKKAKAPGRISNQQGENKEAEPSEPKTLNSKSTKEIENAMMNSVGEQSPCDFLARLNVNRLKRSSHRMKLSIKDLSGKSAVQPLNTRSDGNWVSSVETMSKESPRERCNPSDVVCTTPPENCRTPINAASPVCMGSEYYKQSCKMNLSKICLLKELRSLNATEFSTRSTSSELRKRKDFKDVCVLYSHHLDDDIVKQQKKTLARLGVTLASTITEATHFIADKFVRTRNMLEAIALGKPVVTHLWIESCGQASCFIDEKNYILRDAKKEKVFGFSMPASLACARQHSLLEGRRVLITQNTKPGKDTISCLVKAVKGQALERIGRSMLKDDQIPDDLLVLSCEEDYDICVPFLEKGAAVYSSELLLNGIVTQKLEFERHRLFVDHVKRTRSTVWLKKDGNKFQPVPKRQ